MTDIARLIKSTHQSGELLRLLQSEHPRWRELFSFEQFWGSVLARTWDHRDQFCGETTADFLNWMQSVSFDVAFENLIQHVHRSGELESRLQRHHRRWRQMMDFDELWSSVLARAWDRRQQFRESTPSGFLAWLDVIAFHTCVDKWRHNQREFKAQRDLASDLSIRDSILDQVDARELVQWLLAGLTEQECELLVLKYYEHQSTQELAQSMNRTEKAVYQLHYRALQKLRERLQHSDNSA